MPDPAKGSSVKLAMKLETSYGVSPAGNYVLIPAISFNLGPSQDFLQEDLLGQGRDAHIQDKDVPDRTGSASVPIDRQYLGLWLTLLLGAPTSAGTAPVTHTWKSGSDALPSASIEAQHPDVDDPIYVMHKGVRLSSMQFTMSGRGRVQADLSLSESSMTVEKESGAGSGAGTTAPYPGSFTRFSPTHGKAEVDLGGGFQLIGKNQELQFSWTNNLEDLYYVGGGGNIGDSIPGVPGLTGQVSVILFDTTLLDAAAAGTRFPLRLTYEINASTQLMFDVAQAELASAQPQIQGAGGVALPFNFVGGSLGSTPALTATIKNDLADGTYTPA